MSVTVGSLVSVTGGSLVSVTGGSLVSVTGGSLAHKIHADHHNHKTKDSFFLHGSSMLVEDAATRPGLAAHRPTSLSMRGSPYSSGHVNARATPVGEGDDAGDKLRLSLVEQFQRGKVATSSPAIKKTTFAALPNQTT